MDTESNKFQCCNCHRSPLGWEKQLCGTRAYIGQKQGFLWKKKDRGAERQKKTASILGGIHYRDSRGMLRINPSDAFSVLLTFSLSPKRHVVCQRAFIKLDQRENNVKPPQLSIETCRQVITAKVSLAPERPGSSTQHPLCRAALPSPSQPGIRRGKHAFRAEVY